MAWSLLLPGGDPVNDLTVVIPVHKEDPAIVIDLYRRITALGARVLIVDDGNTMDLPDEVNVISYYIHQGYGYAIKQGIIHTMTPIVLTMDGDGQHTVDDVCTLYKIYKLLDAKMIVGQRWNLNERPLRWVGRKVLNFIASCIAGHYLVDLNSGMRIFDRNMALGYSPILCDTFSFTTSMTMAVVTDRHKMAYIPIDVHPRIKGRSHVKVVRDGLITLYYIVWVGLALRTRRFRYWLRNFAGR